MNKFNRALLMLLLATLVAVASPQNLLAQQQAPEGQGPIADPIRDLNLSPEQRERIRAIREDMRDERANINQRLRETNRALEEVLDSDNPDDALVERRLKDVAEAQAASTRMRVLTEIRVKRVLTPDQLATLRSLRQNARDARRERRLDNQEQRRREGLDRRGIPSRNTIAPSFPRPVNPNRRTQP